METKEMRILKFLIIVISICSASCKRYHIFNMLGGEKVDITHYVKDEQYKPVYNERKEIEYLINPRPLEFTTDDLNKLDSFLREKMDTASIPNEWLKRNIIYSKTYFITFYPVDCYNLSIVSGAKECKMELRKEVDELYKEGRLILPSGDRYICESRQSK